MAVLSKSLALYERDGKGELLPQKVQLNMSNRDKKDYPELVEMEIKIIPLTRGELKSLFGTSGKDTDTVETDSDKDAELILKNCKDPVFTQEEVFALRPVIVRSIVSTILKESGVNIEEDTGVRRLESESDSFGKNS
jgi:hypothetical protein